MTLPLILAAALLAPAQPADSPSGFVSRLYAAYRSPDYSPFRNPARIFAPPLVAALRENERLSSGEVGYLDADPLCQCQDPGGLRASVAAVRRPRPGSAEVRVRIAFRGGGARDLRLRLARTPAGWRIADIATPDEPSFLAGLTAWNRRKRAGR
jgi:Protein of unknown function (DUF3828)